MSVFPHFLMALLCAVFFPLIKMHHFFNNVPLCAIRKSDIMLQFIFQTAVQGFYMLLCKPYPIRVLIQQIFSAQGDLAEDSPFGADTPSSDSIQKWNSSWGPWARKGQPLVAQPVLCSWWPFPQGRSREFQMLGLSSWQHQQPTITLKVVWLLFQLLPRCS